MSGARYFVAKYIPDLLRNEPRNFGVILWTPEGVVARFLAEKRDRPGEVDGRSIPSFVSNDQNYRYWIRYLRTAINKPAIEPVRGGASVPRSAPEFLDVLAQSGRGSYQLVDGGEFVDLNEEEPLGLTAALEQLYAALVDPTGALEDRTDPSLDLLMDRYLSEVGLSSNPHFFNNFSLECRWGQDVSERFEFSHAYSNGTLRLYQRVSFPRRRAALRKTVHDSAWMFDKVAQAEIINHEQGAVVIYAPEEQAEEPEVRSALAVLKSVTRVFNLAQPAPLLSELEALASRRYS